MRNSLTIRPRNASHRNLYQYLALTLFLPILNLNERLGS